MTISSAAVLLAALTAGFSVDGSTEAKKPTTPPAQRKGYSRHVELDFRNAPGKMAPHRLSGKGNYPLRLEIRDVGRSQKPRRVQLLVTVFEQADPNGVRAKTGERILIQAPTRIWTTAPDEDGKHSFDLDIPLPPGDYVSHVFICDPDTPYDAFGMDHHSFPKPEEFPGRMLKGTSVILHVDPADEAAKK